MRVDHYFEKELCQKRRNKKETAGKNSKKDITFLLLRINKITIILSKSQEIKNNFSKGRYLLDKIRTYFEQNPDAEF